MNKSIISLVISGVFILWSYHSFSCTAFCLKKDGKVVAGKSYDWRTNEGFVLTNLRGVKKTSIPTGYGDVFYWTSKYGSITFNQFGKEMPNGGMNEKGLVIEVLWLNDTEYPAPAHLKSVNELQWLQYQLDNHSTVAEVIESRKEIQIVPMFAPLHYFVADAQGNAAVIEFLDGEIVVHTGDELKYNAITNNTYRFSENYLQTKENEETMSRNASLKRFERAARMAEKSHETGKTLVNYALDILDSVRVGYWTKWNIVYDVTGKQVYFKSNSHKKIKQIDLNIIDFSPENENLTLNINNYYAGLINNRLQTYEKELTYNLLLISTKQSNIDLDEEFLRVFAYYTDSLEKLETLIKKRIKNTSNLKVIINGLKNNSGSVRLGLMNCKENYQKLRMTNGGIVNIHGQKSASCMFYHIPQGEYAISFFHDSNYNGRLDKNKLGIPVETVGFSNTGKVRLRTPKYEKVKIVLTKPKQIITIDL